MKTLFKRVAAGSSLALVSAASFAQEATPTTLASLGGALNGNEIKAVILAIAGVLVAVYATIKGARIVMAMVGR